jgi:hypothetical protein
MRSPQQPGCTIDWRRVFSLPVTTPPEVLPPDKVLEYLAVLDTTANILISTFDRFQVSAFGPRQARVAPVGAAAGAPKSILPRVTANSGISDLFDIPNSAIDGGANSVVTKATTPFSAKPPEPGNPVAVETQLQAKLARDKHANQFTPLPIPFTGLDTIRFFFADRAAAGFAGALGLDDEGIIKADGSLAAPLPFTLLPTRADDGNGQVQLGEVDRLILRAPISGRFRFEPYYLYQSAPAFHPVGPSNSGRLIFEQAPLSTRETNTDRTRTLVYKHRYFALDHVDRASVAPIIHRHLVFHLRFLKEMDDHFGGGGAAGEPRLTIEKSSSEVLAAVASDVNHLLRGWTAFLSVLRWRAQDIAVDRQLDATWKTLFPAKELDAKDAKKLLPIVDLILTTPALLESLLFFSEKVYSPLLAGQTWMEVLDANRATDPAVPQFPVTKDQPPFTPKNAANDQIALQHDRLRRVEDPLCRWIGCYAGAPVGKPARVYATVAPVAGAFPADGLTTYEVEALHLAGTAAATLGLPAAVAAEAGPSPGRTMNLNSYAPSARGYSSYFSASTIAEDSLHTVIDFLVELTQGIHFREKEAAFLDIHTLQDQTNGRGHPLLNVLHSDEHKKAFHLRRQMDTLRTTVAGGVPLGEHSVAWWRAKLNLDVTVPLAPTNPYKEDHSVRTLFPGVLQFDDLSAEPPGGRGIPSGFDEFDLTSAYLAIGRMSNPPGSPPLPLPVLLALMETEGIKLFAPVNRIVRNTTTPGNTLIWEALSRDPAHPNRSPFLMPAVPHPPRLFGRGFWFSFPYGLDRFTDLNEPDFRAKVNQFVTSGVLAFEPGEDLGPYVTARVFSNFLLLPAVGANRGVPQIWKLSRRMHWAGLSVMAGFYRQLERDMNAGINGFDAPTAAWLPVGSSPPALVRGDGSRVGPNDTEWKDFLSYYGMIYISYNSNPASLNAFRTSAAAALPGGWAFTLRDFLLFRHRRDDSIIRRMCRFVIALDAYLRLHLMQGLNPVDYAATNGNATALPANRWGL